MVKPKNSELSKTLLCLGNTLHPAIKELIHFRGNNTLLKEDIDASKYSDKLVSLCLKKNQTYQFLYTKT